jgi:mannose/fructose/N-acetylgalactosamine-specific phosphotransferase system component IIB
MENQENIKEDKIKEVEDDFKNFEDNQEDNNENRNTTENKEDILNQDNQKNEEEQIIVGNFNIEDDNQKQLPNINLLEQNISEISNLEEKQETKIIGDVEIKNVSNNNLYYLGNLFRDVVNKYDMEDGNTKQTRKLIRKTITKKKKFK